jgi:hypothetical protein
MAAKSFPLPKDTHAATWPRPRIFQRPLTNLREHLPAIIVWGKAKRNAYPHTEATNAAVAAPHANYAPELPFIRQASSASFDDIYWQLSKVTLADPSKAHALKSEEEKLATEAAGFVTTEKTRISGNCPIITSSQGERGG